MFRNQVLRALSDMDKVISSLLFRGIELEVSYCISMLRIATWFSVDFFKTIHESQYKYFSLSYDTYWDMQHQYSFCSTMTSSRCWSQCDKHTIARCVCFRILRLSCMSRTFYPAMMCAILRWGSIALRFHQLFNQPNWRSCPSIRFWFASLL